MLWFLIITVVWGAAVIIGRYLLEGSSYSDLSVNDAGVLQRRTYWDPKFIKANAETLWVFFPKPWYVIIKIKFNPIIYKYSFTDTVVFSYFVTYLRSSSLLSKLLKVIIPWNSPWLTIKLFSLNQLTVHLWFLRWLILHYVRKISELRHQ